MKCVGKGFTLIEVLVVAVIISLLAAILLPILGKAKRQARSLLGIARQRQIVWGVTNYALAHRDRYPDSVATVGKPQFWNWRDPRMLTASKLHYPAKYRSMSAYLYDYIKNVRVMYCPNAPSEYKYLTEMWEAGDAWDCPDQLIGANKSPVEGTYCFYWNYVGFLESRPYPFKGPRCLSPGRGQSKLLVSDYFGYDHWRSPQAFGSCEWFAGAVVTPGTWRSSAYWSRVKSDGSINLDTLDIDLHAGYTDGHVEGFLPSKVITMKVSIAADGSIPYPSGVGPGDFYLPQNALH